MSYSGDVCTGSLADEIWPAESRKMILDAIAR